MAQQHKTIKHLCCKPLTHIMCLSETTDLNFFFPKETTEEKTKRQKYIMYAAFTDDKPKAERNTVSEC